MRRPTTAALSGLATATALALLSAAPAGAAPQWAPADEATVHPGVQTVTDGAQCTANFVFTSGTDVYIGQSAHCAGTGAATSTNGCEAGSLPLGTEVEVDGATRPGTLAYSSWLTMQEIGETDPDTCAYNDFALVRLDPADHALVNPSMPVWGGPTALGDATAFGEDVFTYGNSGLRLEVSYLSPKTGTSLGTTGDGWTHPIYTVTPGVPGDSGSGVLDSDGAAIGALSTLAIAPLAGSNNATDVASAVAYANAKAGMGVTLAAGTEPFAGLSGINDIGD